MHVPTARGASRLAKPLAALAALLVLLALPAGASAGEIVADSGFRPDPDGFSFENYGDEDGYRNLNSVEMQRMFGPAVCLAGRGARCVLTPTARLWMETQNREMAGGHCFGFATLSELIYDNRLARFGYRSLAAFGRGAEDTFELEIEGNPRLQRAISRAMTYQGLPAVADNAIETTPTGIVNFLRKSLEKPGEQQWTLIIFQADGEGGHAITPFALEDEGNGIYKILVYDNNLPGETRRVTVDTNADTWRYYATTVPGIPEAVYRGDAETKSLGLMPTRNGLGTQPCSFCVGRQGLRSKYNEVRLGGTADDHAHLLIVDSKGRKTGFLGHRLVNQIPGARVVRRTSDSRIAADGELLFEDSPEPVYKVPKNVPFRIRIDGRTLKAPDRETLTLVGPTYDATVEGIAMRPGEVANVRLAPRGNAISYRGSKATRRPTVSFGAEARNAAYRISVTGLNAPPRSAIAFVKRPRFGLMRITDGTPARRTYRLLVEGYTTKGIVEMGRKFAIRGRQQAYLFYGPLARANGTPAIAIYNPGRERVAVLPLRVLESD